jgi:hypothetical protein
MSGIKEAMQVIVDRLKTISVANGYMTELGKNVAVNVDSSDVHKLPAITVFSGEGELLSTTRTCMKFSREILIESVFKVCPDDEVMDAEDYLLDIHKALLEPECKCGSATEKLDGNVWSLDMTKYSITERKDGKSLQGIALVIRVEYSVVCCQHKLG